MVTSEQAALAKELGVNLDKTPKKLISSNDPRTIVTYIDNLLYSMIHMSAKVVEVTEIIQFKQEAVLKPYIEDLQQKRATAPSGLLNKAIKALG